MTININPAHKGSLTKIVGKKGLTVPALTKEISSAKKTGNVALEKKAVFAKNAKGFNHTGSQMPKKVTPKPFASDRGTFKMK